MLNDIYKVIIITAIIVAVGVASPAHAAPFTCTGEIYQVQSGQLRVFDPIESEYVNIGSANASYNATGYNVQDNFAYGSQGNDTIIRIHSDGTIEDVYDIGVGSFAGDVDVLANTPADTYSFEYQICEIINPSNCDRATITVSVIPTVDLIITKTNTPGVNGEVDQASDNVVSGPRRLTRLSSPIMAQTLFQVLL